jgi:hypothetical protein
MTIITIASVKQGSGKTTVAQFTVGALVVKGISVAGRLADQLHEGQACMCQREAEDAHLAMRRRAGQRVA